MNVIVEVTTAEVVVKTDKVLVFTGIDFPKVSAPVVVTSTMHVLDILRYSIDAVAPNTIFRKEPALAAA